MIKRKNYGEAEQHYRTIRREAHEFVAEELATAFNGRVKLTDIDDVALQAAAAWRNAYPAHRVGHTPGWDWSQQLRRFRKRARRVEAALWHDATLCGLAVGRISRGHLTASLHFLEAGPLGNPLQGAVAPIMVRFLETMAVAVGCKEVSIEWPVDGLIEFYANKLGFVEKVAKRDKIIRLKKRIATPESG